LRENSFFTPLASKCPDIMRHQDSLSLRQSIKMSCFEQYGLCLDLKVSNKQRNSPRGSNTHLNTNLTIFECFVSSTANRYIWNETNFILPYTESRIKNFYKLHTIPHCSICDI